MLGSSPAGCTRIKESKMSKEALEALNDIINIGGYSVDQMCSEQIKTIKQALEWQPIETAPKDGTGALLNCPRGDGSRFCIVGFFHSDEWFAVPYETIYQPDKWMPLPKE